MAANIWQALANIAGQPIAVWIEEERVADVPILGSNNWVDVVGRLSLVRRYVEVRIEDIFERCLVPVLRPTDGKLIDSLWRDSRADMWGLVDAFDECNAEICRGEEYVDRFVIVRPTKGPCFLSVPIAAPGNMVRVHKTSVNDLLVALGTSWACGALTHSYAANARAIFCHALTQAWEVLGSPNPSPEE